MKLEKQFKRRRRIKNGKTGGKEDNYYHYPE
jgi:hypothetical protein